VHSYFIGMDCSKLNTYSQCVEVPYRKAEMLGRSDFKPSPIKGERKIEGLCEKMREEIWGCIRCELLAESTGSGDDDTAVKCRQNSRSAPSQR